MFRKMRERQSLSRMLEEQLFAQVATELSQGMRREGLWAKAVADSAGSNEKTASLYMKYRVQSIKDEVIVTNRLATKDVAAVRRGIIELEPAARKEHENMPPLSTVLARLVLLAMSVFSLILAIGFSQSDGQMWWLSFVFVIFGLYTFGLLLSKKTDLW